MTYKVFAEAHSKIPMNDLFSDILSDDDRRKQYPGLKILFEIYLILIVCTAVCEGGFSSMKRVKNDWRSCLATDQLRRLMFTVKRSSTQGQV